MSIIDFTEPEKVNPYDEKITELIAAGEGKGMELTVSNKDLSRVKLQVAKAANDQNRTARKRIEEPMTPDSAEGEKDGTTRLVYTLTAKHAPRVRKSAEETPEKADDAVSAKPGKTPAK